MTYPGNMQVSFEGEEEKVEERMLRNRTGDAAGSRLVRACVTLYMGETGAKKNSSR